MEAEKETPVCRWRHGSVDRTNLLLAYKYLEGDDDYYTQPTIGGAADIQIPLTPYFEWSDGKAHTDKEILNRWFDRIAGNINMGIIETSNRKDF